MRELDIVLTRFLDRDYATLDTATQAAFASLLDVADPDLYAWILGQSLAPTAEHRELITLFQRRATL